MLGQWALLAYILFDLPTANKVEATPSRDEAFNGAYSTNKDSRHYMYFIDS